MKNKLFLLSLVAVVLSSCQQQTEKKVQPKIAVEHPKPVFESTYKPQPSNEFVITNTTILTGTGERIDNADIWVKSGKIQALGRQLEVAPELKKIDGQGKWVTPGLIDVHSHLGVYPSPSHEAAEDGNEMTAPVTSQVWAEHSVWTQDPGFDLARAGGVTSLLILPGSGNLIGGRGVTLKNVPAQSVQAMKFPGAPHALKMACGENPKRVYGREKSQAPMTRMGNVAGYREAWIEATAYKEKWDKYYAQAEPGYQGEAVEKPERDLKLETLAEVLNGHIKVHNHCYRAEEMMVMIDIAKEFNYTISTFHHAVEAYKIADQLESNNICAAMWADWWGFKHEAYDTVTENVAMVDKARACAIVHSDSAIGIQHLNQETAKAMAAGNRQGLNITPQDAIQWITYNPAKSMGIEQQTGSLEINKNADIVLWNGNPFSIYSKAEKVFIDGAMVFSLDDPENSPVSDFNLGITDPEGERL